MEWGSYLIPVTILNLALLGHRQGDEQLPTAQGCPMIPHHRQDADNDDDVKDELVEQPQGHDERVNVLAHPES